MDLAADQDFNALLGNILTGAGMTAGIVGGAFLMSPTGGVINPANGASLGASTGSFLGNAFAR